MRYRLSTCIYFCQLVKKYVNSRFLKLLGSFSIAIILFSSPIFAIELKQDSTLVQGSNYFNRIKKVIISPIKRNTSLNVSNNTFAKDIFYYFPRNGLKGFTPGYIIFEDGDVFTLSAQKNKSRSKTNLSSAEVLILLVYRDVFELKNFEGAITRIKTILTERIIPLSDLTSPKDIEIRKFAIVNRENEVELDFSEINPISTEFIKLINDIDFSKKLMNDLKVSSPNKLIGLPPNAYVDASITIQNSSDFDAYFGESLKVAVKTAKDSSIFVPDIWVTTKTIFQDKKSLVDARGSKTYNFKIKTPLLPGNYKEEMLFEINDEIKNKFELTYEISDIGQKVLKIKPTGIGYLIVRKDASGSAPETGRASEGGQYLYSDLSNGYYKIDFNEKPGWVSSRYIEIIKSK